MKTADEFLQQAAVDLQRAREANETGNLGKARTASRRAAGYALLALKCADGGDSGDVMKQLRRFMDDATTPQDLREAAKRLQERITEEFTSPYSMNPVEDALSILDYVKKSLDKLK